MAGMVRFHFDPTAASAPLVAITMFGVTTPGVLAIQSGLEALGFETIVFHAVGSGGRAMEEMVDAGLIDAVVDVTTSELTDELLGGIFPGGPHRLEAAGRMGIPQVVVPGAMEVLNFGPRDSVPAHLDVPERPLVIHNPSVCAVRIDAQESRLLGRILAAKVNAATGPSAVVLPLGGLSKYELPGGPFRDLAADEALFAEVRSTLRPDIVVREVDANVNDPAFAEAVIEVFRERWTCVRPLPGGKETG
jgi:uncharacterized protein (UPF0261 family)